MCAWLVRSVAIFGIASVLALAPNRAARAGAYGGVDVVDEDAATGIVVGVSVAIAAVVGGLVWYFFVREDEPEVRGEPEPIAPAGLTEPFMSDTVVRN